MIAAPAPAPRHAKDVECERLAIFALSARVHVLARQDEGSNLQVRTFCFGPFDGCLVERHGGRVGAPLHHEFEAIFAIRKPVGQIGREIITRIVGDVDRRRFRIETIFENLFVATAKRQNGPIGRRQHAAFDLLHRIEQFGGLRMARQIRRVVALHHARIGELTHLLGIVDKKDRKILHDEVGGIAVFAQSTGSGHAEHFDADSHGRKQVRRSRRGVARESDPCGQALMREDPDFEIVGNVGEHAQFAVRDAVQLAENRALGRRLTEPDPLLLNHAHKHLEQPFARLIGAIEASRNWTITAVGHV